MKKTHNKGLSLLIISVVISPLLFIIWMIGWILYFIGSEKLLITKRKELVTPQKITQQETYKQELEPKILA